MISLSQSRLIEGVDQLEQGSRRLGAEDAVALADPSLGHALSSRRRRARRARTRALSPRRGAPAAWASNPEKAPSTASTSLPTRASGTSPRTSRQPRWRIAARSSSGVRASAETSGGPLRLTRARRQAAGVRTPRPRSAPSPRTLHGEASTSRRSIAGSRAVRVGRAKPGDGLGGAARRTTRRLGLRERSDDRLGEARLPRPVLVMRPRYGVVGSARSAAPRLPAAQTPLGRPPGGAGQLTTIS